MQMYANGTNGGRLFLLAFDKLFTQFDALSTHVPIRRPVLHLGYRLRLRIFILMANEDDFYLHFSVD